MQTRLGRPLRGSRVHFVAIGGVGMAALAELLLKMGYTVSGSDLKASRTTRRLSEIGATVSIGPHQPGEVDGADAVVVSNAVPAGNLAIARARESGAEVLLRAELLARFLEAGRAVTVSGTHGKTTTSSMLALALQAAGMDPSFVIGGDLNDVGSGAHLGSSDLVVAEADEAYGSFAYLKPDVAVVTNVDADHLDFYDSQRAIDDAFVDFLAGRRDGGTAVVCADDPGISRIRGDIAAPVVTYGTSGADLVITPDGDLTWRGAPIGSLRLRTPGRHHVLNAGGATAAAMVLGADPAPVLEGLAAFSGVDRRFSVRGARGGVTVVDDYAHTPREVAVNIQTAREAYPDGRVVVLFQPHLYSRTRLLAAEFGNAFDEADLVVVTDVYAAREEPVPGVSGRLVCDAIRRTGAPGVVATYVPRLEEAAGVVAGLAEPGDVVLTLGAGDVTTAAPRILELLAEPPS